MTLAELPAKASFLTEDNQHGQVIANMGDSVICAVAGVVGHLTPDTPVRHLEDTLSAFKEEHDKRLRVLYADNAALRAQHDLSARVGEVEGNRVALLGVEIFAQHFSEVLAEFGGQEYLELELGDPPVIVTIRHATALAPQDVTLLTKDRLRTLQGGLRRLEQITNSNHPDYIGDPAVLAQEVRNIVDDAAEKDENLERDEGVIKHLSELQNPVTKAPFDQATADLIEERAKSLREQKEKE